MGSKAPLGRLAPDGVSRARSGRPFVRLDRKRQLRSGADNN